MVVVVPLWAGLGAVVQLAAPLLQVHYTVPHERVGRWANTYMAPRPTMCWHTFAPDTRTTAESGAIWVVHAGPRSSIGGPRHRAPVVPGTKA